MLLIECILLMLNLVVVELPDRRIDSLSLSLSIAAWIFLLLGLWALSTARVLPQQKVFWIPLTGLLFYCLGCLAIALELWNLVYIVPVGLLLTAGGMLLLGIAAIRSKAWKGW
ncbi:hypothetical protein [Larkinella soli]|uniref:hypothetical protein n=1 Tax=Larkinella soli TaxID=1770527 RepID=UPI000FFC8AFD|nr:hypothetical protein [Larkinella soli]